MQNISEEGVDLGQLQGAEFPQVSFPNIPPQAQAHRAALAFAFHQARFLQLFQVVRDGSGADGAVLAQLAALQHGIFGNLLQDGKAARFADGTRDRLHLLGG